MFRGGISVQCAFISERDAEPAPASAEVYEFRRRTCRSTWRGRHSGSWDFSPRSSSRTPRRSEGERSWPAFFVFQPHDLSRFSDVVWRNGLFAGAFAAHLDLCRSALQHCVRIGGGGNCVSLCSQGSDGERTVARSTRLRN